MNIYCRSVETRLAGLALDLTSEEWFFVTCELDKIYRNIFPKTSTFLLYLKAPTNASKIQV